MKEKVSKLTRFLSAGIFFVLFCLGCASRIAGECPETTSEKCLTGKVCSHDAKRGCEVCHCDVADPTQTGSDGMPMNVNLNEMP